jgi:conjugal transfer pilus assembly protein TraW
MLVTALVQDAWKTTGVKYLISTMIIKILIVIDTLTPMVLYAKDFGIIGQTFSITEEPFIEMLKKRLDKIDLEQEKQKIQKAVKERVENPLAVLGVNPAIEDRVFYFDPSYILDKDVILPCGKILHKAGTKVNPLEHMDLSRRLFFIDARIAAQLAWLKEQLNKQLAKQEQKEQVEDRVILVSGSVFKLQELLGEKNANKVYFDQAGELTSKFGIKASPAIVVQEGLKLKIEEVALKE